MSGLRDHAGTVPQMARCSAARVVEIGAREMFTAIESSHATSPGYLGYKQDSVRSGGVAGAVRFDPVCAGIVLEGPKYRNRRFGSNAYASTNGGGDNRDWCDRWASGLTAASKAPRSMENLGRRVDPHRRERGSLHWRRGHNNKGFRPDG